MEARMLPECYHCKYDGQGHPCRSADGNLDYEKIARAYVDSRQAYLTDTVDEAMLARTRWTSDCAFEIEENYPDELFALVLVAMDVCRDLEDAAFVAAGLVENMLVKHGPELIDAIETMAWASAKFRYILSGAWSQNGSVDADVWARVGCAVAEGGRMSNDGRGPWDGAPVSVLDDAAAMALLQESVTGAALRAGLIAQDGADDA
jgi:hypothetical protein